MTSVERHLPVIAREQWLSVPGSRLFVRVWSPAAKIRGVVVLVHGLGEHSGRYAEVAAQLNVAGYLVLGYDLRGHGSWDSEGNRGLTTAT